MSIQKYHVKICFLSNSIYFQNQEQKDRLAMKLLPINISKVKSSSIHQFYSKITRFCLIPKTISHCKANNIS